MKNFLSFCAAICIILLVSFLASPSYAGMDGKQKTEYSYSAKSDLNKITLVNVNSLAVFISPGDLTKRIQIPEPMERIISNPVENEKSRDKENRKLKEIVYKDHQPPSNI